MAALRDGPGHNPRNPRAALASWRDQLGGLWRSRSAPDRQLRRRRRLRLRISTVAILDRDTGETIALTWPRVREGDHFDAVMAVAFHPDGERVGFGTADGTLWLWTPEKLTPPDKDRTWSAPVRVGQFTAFPDSPYNFPRNLHFPDKNTLVGVAARGQVLECKLNRPFTDNPNAPTPQGTTLFDTSAGLPPRYALDQAAWSGDGSGCGTTTVSVLVRSADGKRVVQLELPPDHVARSLAVHPKSGKIAIGVASIHPATPDTPRFYAERDDEIWIYEKPMGAEVPKPTPIKHSGRAEALAFHPTEDRLAIAGGDSDEVKLLDLANPEKSVSVARGLGRRLYGLNLSESGDVIAVRTGRNPEATDPNDRACGPWTRFNISRYESTADASGKWIGPLRTSHGWEIVPDSESDSSGTRAREPSGRTGTVWLALDPT